LYPLIHLTEDLNIPSFFLVISLVVTMGLFWIAQRSDRYGIPKKNILDLSLLLMISSLLGGRVFHVVYENLEYYGQNPVRIFYLWEGGFVFYGGMIFSLISAIAYLKFIHAPKKGIYFDAFAPVLSFVYGFGRLGCFLAGCCFGKTCDYPWAVAGRHPTQIYALLWEAGTILLLLGVEKIELKKRPKFINRSGDLFFLWLLLHSFGRILMEFYREDYRGEEILGLSISTVFSFVLLLVSTTLLCGFGRNWRFFKKL